VRRFLTPRWLAWHLVVLVLVTGCLALGWWQLRRAQGGNLLSIGYSVEWPVFAAFTVGVWVREIRVARRAARPGPVPDPARPADPLLMRVPPPSRSAVPAPQDAELAAYNDYLAWLAAHPEQSPADYLG